MTLSRQPFLFRVRPLAVVGAVVSVLALAPAANGSFPGRNGRFAITLDCDFSPYLRAYSPRGRDLGPLTRRCEVVQVPEGSEDIVRETSSPEWSPDGQNLIFQEIIPGARVGDRVLVAGSSRLLMASTDGSDQRPVPLPGGSFAPDGRHLVFAADDAIWTAALDGSDKHLVWRCPLPCLNLLGGLQPNELRWSPDGRYIALTIGPNGLGQLGPGVWLMSARTGKLLRRVARGADQPDWSPDARRLVYRSDYYAGGLEDGGFQGGDLFVASVRGKRAPRLLHDGRGLVVQPTWSPDGRSIAWISLGVSGEAFLRKLPAHGGRGRTIVRLPRVSADEEIDFFEPELAWQSLPRG